MRAALYIGCLIESRRRDDGFLFPPRRLWHVLYVYTLTTTALVCVSIRVNFELMYTLPSYRCGPPLDCNPVLRDLALPLSYTPSYCRRHATQFYRVNPGATTGSFLCKQHTPPHRHTHTHIRGPLIATLISLEFESSSIYVHFNRCARQKLYSPSLVALMLILRRGGFVTHLRLMNSPLHSRPHARTWLSQKSFPLYSIYLLAPARNPDAILHASHSVKGTYIFFLLMRCVHAHLRFWAEMLIATE